MINQFVINQLVINKGAPMSTTTLTVPGMTCGHCSSAVTSEVSKVAGVTAVVVDLDTKLVTIEGDNVDHAALVAAVDEAGFEVAEP